MTELPTFASSSCVLGEADNPAIRFSHKARIVPSGVAGASQLTLGEMVAELGFDYHNPQQRTVRGRRKADLKVDSVAFGEGFRPFQDVVVRKVRDPESFEESADASGSQLGLAVVEE